MGEFMSDVAPGWYPDGSGSERFWGGTEWTEQMRPIQVASTPPPPPVTETAPQASVAQSPRNGLGTTALVLGIVGLIIALIPIIFGLGGFLGLLAFIFGLVGWSRARKGGATNKGVALAGTILGFIAIVAAVVNFVITIAFVGAVATSVDQAVSATKSTPGPSSTCSTVQYPDQQSLDTCSDATGTVDLGGVKVSASPLRRSTDSLGSSQICDDVTLVNTTSATIDYSVSDFKLQPPSGAIVDSKFFGGTFGSGVLITGGTKSGQVCFSEDVPETGTFVLIYKPNPFEDNRGIWLGSL